MDYTSGFLGTRDTGHYFPAFARYEMRAKLPHGQGLWPAFWLRHRAGSSTTEVDIMEYFHSVEPGEARQSLHFPAEISYNTVHKPFPFEAVRQGTGDWHTFAVDIEPLDGGARAKFVFSIDNKTTYEYTPAKFGWLNNYDKNNMFDIAVNMAVGGNWTGDPASQLGYLKYPNICSLTSKTPTNNDPSTCPTNGIQFGTLPAQYDVDYVRVYTH